MQPLIELFKAIGASGVTTFLIALVNVYAKSQIKAEEKVDKTREHLQDEINWLRQQLAVEKGKNG